MAGIAAIPAPTIRDTMRKFLLFSLRVLVSAALLYFALRSINFASVQERFSQVNVWWLLLAVGATLFQIALGALRWHQISALSEAPLSMVQALRYNLIGAFFNQTLPSTIGGDAMRLWLVQRHAGWRAATYSVLVDRAIGFIALASIVIASLPWSYELITNQTGRIALLLIDVGAVLAGAGFLLLRYLPWEGLKRIWPIRHIHACSVIASKALFARESGPKVIVTSILIHVMTVVITWFTVFAISANAGFEQLFLLIPPIMLVTMLPVSIAGWGVREATMMVAFGYAGLATADGTVVSLLFGAVFFLVGGIGGVVWMLSPEEASPSR